MMFEGFPDGPWHDENYEDYPPPESPKWWEWLIALGVLAAFWVAFFDFFRNG